MKNPLKKEVLVLKRRGQPLWIRKIHLNLRTQTLQGKIISKRKHWNNMVQMSRFANNRALTTERTLEILAWIPKLLIKIRKAFRH